MFGFGKAQIKEFMEDKNRATVKIHGVCCNLF